MVDTSLINPNAAFQNNVVAPTMPQSTPATLAPTLTSSLVSVGVPQQAASDIAHATVTPTTTTYAKAAGYTGPSVTDFLTIAGQPADFNSRAKLASSMGIADYTGTAAQNTQLLNLLRGHNVSVFPTGIPSNLYTALGTPKPQVPAANSPVPVSSLTPTGSSSGLDLSSILGAGSSIPGASDIAGLLSLYGASSDASKSYDDTSKALIEQMNALGGQSADLTTAFNEAGIPDAQKHLADLNLQAAQLKGTLDKFDAETQAGLSGIENQQIPQGLVQGQQAAYQKQRDLTRLSMAAELSSITSLATAYQGNIDTATKLAQQSVDMKYAPIENNVKTLQAQLAIAKDRMSTQDSKNATIIGKLLDFKMQQITDQKANDKALQTMGVQAASGGAPLSLVRQALATGDQTQAASILSAYLKGPAESISSSGTTTFSNTQTNSGAANAQLPIADFKLLSDDTKNWFINSYSTFTAQKKLIDSGQRTANEVALDIQNSQTMPQEVKGILLNQLGVSNPQPQGGGGVWSTIGSWLGNALHFTTGL